MRYLCVHCDHRFEHEEGGKKPRCPKCMRVHGIEKIGKGKAGGKEAGGSGEGARKPWVLPAVVATVLVAVGGGYWLWASGSPAKVEGDPPLEPLSQAELKGYLKNEGVSAEAAGDAFDVLAPSDTVEDFGDDAGEDEGSNVAKAEAVVGALRARASKQAFVSWSLGDPREDPLRTPAETLESIQKDDAREQLYPLEVAALAVRALRAVDVGAMVAEAWGFEGDTSPPDPSGRYGYYVVAVWKGEPGKGKPAKLLDPWGGRATEPSDEEYRTLTDVQVVAAALNHLAVHRLVRDGDVQAAVDLSEKAVELDPRSPTIRTVHGMAMVQAGGVNEGLEELQSASQLRSDSPRHLRLAEVYLAQGDVGRASKEITAALEQHPDYAAAHAMLAAVHLSKGEIDLARSELETAERSDAEVAVLPVLWAQYYMRQGELEKAVDKAREAVDARPHDWQTRLQAATVFRQGGYYEEMRRQAQEILEMVPESREQHVRKLIEQVLGPTAFDEPLGDAGLGGMPDGGLALPSPDDLGDMDLQKGSKLLGDGQGDLGGGGPSLGGGGPSLGGGGDLGGGPSLGGGGGLKLGGGGSKLRLRDPGESLRMEGGGGE